MNNTMASLPFSCCRQFGSYWERILFLESRETRNYFGHGQHGQQCPGIHPLDGILSAGEYLCPDSYRHIEMSCC